MLLNQACSPTLALAPDRQPQRYSHRLHYAQLDQVLSKITTTSTQNIDCVHNGSLYTMHRYVLQCKNKRNYWDADRYNR